MLPSKGIGAVLEILLVLAAVLVTILMLNLFVKQLAPLPLEIVNLMGVMQVKLVTILVSLLILVMVAARVAILAPNI